MGSIPRDEAAQMMLFGAVVILLSFLALAGAVVRISQLASETLQEQESPLLLEVDAVAEAMDEAVRVLVKENEGAPTVEEQGAAVAAAMTPALNHLKILESSRGFVLQPAGDLGPTSGEQWFACDDAGRLHVAFQMGDGATHVTVHGLETFPSPAAVPYDGCVPP